MEHGLISVIVPVYNVEKYLPRCVDSILAQTYIKLEIILVDDGSPDRCGIICDEYAKKDPRIHVIHKKNGGLSDARNTGLRAAIGEYIMFIDSDDSIAPNMCEKLLQALVNQKADISICNFCRVYSDGRSTNNLSVLSSEKIYSGREALSLYVRKGPVELTIACNKLYKKNLFTENHLFYPLGRLHEDEFLCKYLLGHAEKIVYTDQPFYLYLQRENSIMGKVTEQRFRDGVDYVRELYHFVMVNAPDLQPFAWKRLLDELYVLLMLKGKVPHKEQYLRLLKKDIQVCAPSISAIKEMGWKCILKYIAFRIHLANVMAMFINVGHIWKRKMYTIS